MQRKYKLILSLICFILTIIFVICGIILFNNIPVEMTLTIHTNAKDEMLFSGCFASFFMAIANGFGSFIFLCWGFLNNEEI